nr:hypothetical protein [Rufibacter sediminis]
MAFITVLGETAHKVVICLMEHLPSLRYSTTFLFSCSNLSALFIEPLGLAMCLAWRFASCWPEIILFTVDSRSISAKSARLPSTIMVTLSSFLLWSSERRFLFTTWVQTPDSASSRMRLRTSMVSLPSRDSSRQTTSVISPFLAISSTFSMPGRVYVPGAGDRLTGSVGYLEALP